MRPHLMLAEKTSNSVREPAGPWSSHRCSVYAAWISVHAAHTVPAGNPPTSRRPSSIWRNAQRLAARWNALRHSAHPQLLHGNRHPPITPQQPLPPQERALRPWMRKELKGSEGSSQGWMRSGWMVRMCQMRPLCARAPGRGFRAAAAPDPHRRGGAQVASGGGRLHAVRHRVRSLATQNYRRGTTSPSGVIPFRNLKRSLPVERTSIVFSAMMDL